jgi:hypothetical protein
MTLLKANDTIIYLFSDDDAYIRSITRYQRVVKAPSHIARYYTHDHKADKPNEARSLLSISIVKNFDDLKS